MNMTTTGQLQYGFQDEQGAWHKDFELRLATLEDVENAIEEAGESACAARIQRHQWAHTVTRLGTLPKHQITASTLAQLEATEYGILTHAQEELRKKLVAVSASTENAAT